jgi:hypothetical protein
VRYDIYIYDIRWLKVNKGDFCLNKITCSLVYSVMNKLENIGNLNLKQGLCYFLLGTLKQVL